MPGRNELSIEARAVLNIPGYRSGTWLCNSRGARIYRGSRLADGLPVIFKFPLAHYPTPGALAALRHEYELILRAQPSGAVIGAHALIDIDRTQVLVLEDIDGTDLRTLLQGRRQTLRDFLPMAIAIVESLARLHGLRISHNDLNPANIIYNPATGALRLTDLGISTAEGEPPASPDGLEGSLAYIAPEQTGRTSRRMDYRVDFYALGVTFYEMLAGRLPFTSADPLALVHGHLAVEPPSLLDRVPSLPASLARLVEKLMAKAAEDRYQSAFGILEDLRAIQRGLADGQSADMLELGRKDRAATLRLPTRPYGRDDAIRLLAAQFDKAADGGSCLAVISGPSGAGKTFTVNAYRNQRPSDDALWVQGKFDPLQRDIPYSALRSAARQLIEFGINGDRGRVEALRLSLGEHAGLLASLLPELEGILGPLPTVMDLPPAETQSRFDYVVRRFVQSFATSRRPLTLFLDDIQWADAASFRLLTVLLRPPLIHHAQLIVSVRDDAPASAAAAAFMDRLREVPGLYLPVMPLALPDVTQLIADTLPWCPEQEAELAELCLAKTLGNPFYLNRFLAALYRERLVEFDGLAGHWTWDLSRIDRWGVFGNVIEFMVEKLKRLPDEVRILLQMAASIGNRFHPATLAALESTELSEVLSHLDHLVHEGLLIVTSESADTVELQFLHDQVRQAAYLLRPEEERQAVHLQIGRYLLGFGEAADLFDRVNHLNAASALLVDEDDRLAVASLNLEAARRSQQTGGHPTARGLLQHAAVLAGDRWESNPALLFSIHLAWAECEQMCGEPDEALAICARLLDRLNDPLAHADVRARQADVHASMGRFAEAMDAAVQGLKVLGEAWPHDDAGVRSATASDKAFVEAWLDSHDPSELIELPALEDPRVERVMRLLGLLWGPAINLRLPAGDLAIVRIVRLSLEHGNGDQSPFGYGNYASMLSSVLHQYELGFRFGQTSVQLVEQTSNLPLRSKVYTLFALTNSPWSSPISESVPLLRMAQQAGQLTGDVIWTAYSTFHILKHLQHAGETLDALLGECAQAGAVLKRIGDSNTLEAFEVLNRSIALLQGRTPHTGTWNDGDFDEIALRETIERNGHGLCLNYYHYNKMQAGYVFRAFEPALAHAQAMDATRVATFGWFSNAEHVFYEALIRIALLAGPEGRQRTEHLPFINAHREQLAVWTIHCPANFKHKLALVDAELARAEGRHQAASDHFEIAIDAAREEGFRQDTAMAEEAYGRFWLACGKSRIARAYLADAQRSYLHWGATAKATALAAEFPRWLTRETGAVAGTEHWPATPGRGNTDMARLDWMSILRSLQTISTELSLEQLLPKMMRILLEEAGAQQGALMLPQGDDWAIRSALYSDGREVAPGTLLALTEPLQQGKESVSGMPVPLSLIRQVIQTREAVILSDASERGSFMGDPYIQAHRPRSILCQPVVRHDRLIGLLYLENNLLPEAFTADRQQTLTIIAAQAAIALEHAELYETLEQRVAERTAELDDARIRAEDAANAKSMFLATISHEIRTPLNAVIGLSRLTLRTPLDAEQQGHVEKILGAGETLLSVINDVLDFSRNEAGGTTLERVRFSLAKVLERTLSLCTLRAHEKRLELILEQGPDVPGNYMGDPLRLQQILINLVGNAIKFTESGHVRLSVTTQSPVSNTVALRFAVEDTGIGMSETQQRGLFQAFNQGDGSITRRFGGTGLGLAICRQLATLMQGDIHVQSEPGRGSCFSFCVTLAVASPGAEIRTGLPKGLRVMVIDDHDVAREALCRQLRYQGVEVIALASGLGAQESVRHALSAGSLDAILVDRDMPGVSGADTIRAIQAIAAEHHIALILLASPYELADGRDQALDVVVKETLEKPVLPGALRDTLLALRQPRSVSASPARKTAWLDLEGVRVLLVDDSPINRQVVIGFLQDTGVTLETASDGQEALEKVAAGQYDLVFMDIHMPIMDGLTAVRRIREQPEFADLPVIAMTADALPGDRETSLAAGMTDHLVKPVDPGELYRLLSTWVVRSPIEVSAVSPASMDEAADVAFMKMVRSLGVVDSDNAVKRLHGRPSLYRQLIRGFLQDNQSLVPRLTALKAENDTKGLLEAAHSLHSVGAYLGADALSESARALEYALRDGAPYEAGIDSLIQAASQTLEGLSPLQSLFDTSIRRGSSKGSDLMEHALGKLLSLLETSDFEAETFLPTVQQLGEGTPCEQTLRKVAEFVDDVEFERAADAVAHLLRQLRRPSKE